MKTIPHWKKWALQLKELQTELMPLAFLAEDKLCCDWWDSQPLVCNLEEAFNGFSNIPEAQLGGEHL